MHLDLMRGEAERLQRAHLHALVVDHAGEGRHNDQRGDGVGQHREDQRHVFKHLRVVVGARRAPVRGAIHNQRVGQERPRSRPVRFRCPAPSAMVATICVSGSSGMAQALTRMKPYLSGSAAMPSVTTMYSGLTTTPRMVNEYGLPRSLTVSRSPSESPFDCAKALLDEAAARVVGLKQRALAQQRLVDGHFAVVNRDGNGNVAGERRVQIHRGARADRLHIRQRRELLHGSAVGGEGVIQKSARLFSS